MKRREFLTMALGAVFLLPLANQAAAKATRENKISNEIIPKLYEICIEYVNGNESQRQAIISDLDEIRLTLKSQKAKKFFGEFRNTLLSYNAIPAATLGGEK